MRTVNARTDDKNIGPLGPRSSRKALRCERRELGPNGLLLFWRVFCSGVAGKGDGQPPVRTWRRKEGNFLCGTVQHSSTAATTKHLQ